MSTGRPRRSARRAQSSIDERDARHQGTADAADLTGGPHDDQPAQALRTENQARILEVAVREFTEKGLTGARVAEIAQQAGVNKQMLYYYYGSKEGLYNAVIGHMMEVSRETIATLEDADLNGITEAFLGGITTTELPRRRMLRRLWMWEALERGAEDIARDDERRALWAQVVGLVSRAIERGEIDERFDPEMLLLAIDAVLNGPWMLPQDTYLVTGLRPDDEAFRARLAEFFRHLIAALAAHE